MRLAIYRMKNGFTLIEMLVAMAIFSALIVVLMVGFRQGLMMWEKGEHQSREWLDYELRYRLLDTMFSQALISDNEYKKGFIAPFFKGTESSFRFISAAPIMDIPGRVKPVELESVQAINGRWSLRYREGFRYSDSTRGLRWRAETVNLLEGLQSINFSYEARAFPMPEYLSSNDLNEEEKLRYRDTTEWLNQFDSYKIWSYPIRVAVRFQDANGEAHEWLFVSPRFPDAWTMEVYVDQ